MKSRIERGQSSTRLANYWPAAVGDFRHAGCVAVPLLTYSSKSTLGRMVFCNAVDREGTVANIL